jgi:acyl-coenzyme A synthetase/AMP-(fatty) acid ligase
MIAIADTGPAAACPVRFNLAAHVLAAGAAVPAKCALEIVGPTRSERWRYASLIEAVRGTGSGLLAMGLRPGDRVLLRLSNSVAFPILFLGAIAVGLVPVPVAAGLTLAEMTRVLAEIRPAAIAASPGLALPAAPGCPVLLPDALRALQRHAPCAYAMGDPDRLAYMIYTSGSSGNPRAVMHAHRAIWARRMMHQGWYGMTSSDRILHAGGFNWTFTLGTGLMDPWSLGATALIPAEGVVAAQLPLLLARHDATLFAAAPGVVRQMLRAGLPTLPHLRHGLVAGERLPETLRADWRAATDTALHEALGMSECSTFVSGSPDRPAPPGAVGYPQPGRRIAVLDPEGHPVARGQEGVLAVCRSDPGLFLGYLDQPGETQARHRGEWFLTGDRVVMAEDGAITYIGREDDMMNAGGFRVAPQEVERAMAGIEGLEDCAAREIEVRPGVSVIALFYTAAGGPLDQSQLKAHAETWLARYKQPRIFQHLPALPRGPNNKIARRALRLADAPETPLPKAPDDNP